jgi:hypothetical protein
MKKWSEFRVRSKTFEITSDEQSPVDVACFAPNYIELSGHSKI